MITLLKGTKLLAKNVRRGLCHDIYNISDPFQIRVWIDVDQEATKRGWAEFYNGRDKEAEYN